MGGLLKYFRRLGLFCCCLLAPSIIFGSVNPQPYGDGTGKYKQARRNIQIFRAESDAELNGLLQTVYLDYKKMLRENGPDNPCYLFIFVDIDNVIFAHGTDYKLYRNGATYTGLEVLIPETIQTLNQLLDEDNKISVLALTSSKAWTLDEEEEETLPKRLQFTPVATGVHQCLENDINDESYLLGYPCHKIRSGALDAARLKRRPFRMPSLTLGLPFVALNPVLENYTPTQEQEGSMKPVSLVEEASTQSFNSLDLFRCEPPKPTAVHSTSTHPFQSRISSDPCFLARNHPLIDQGQDNFNDNQNNDQDQPIPSPYKRVVAYPFYSDGIIYSNFVNHTQEGWQKGRIMQAYLETVFGTDVHSWPQISVIAIDDNDMMLTNMEDVARTMGIHFKGLFFKRKEPVFWIFCKPKENKKQPPQGDFDGDLIQFS